MPYYLFEHSLADSSNPQYSTTSWISIFRHFTHQSLRWRDVRHLKSCSVFSRSYGITKLVSMTHAVICDGDEMSIELPAVILGPVLHLGLGWDTDTPIYQCNKQTDCNLLQILCSYEYSRLSACLSGCFEEHEDKLYFLPLWPHASHSLAGFLQCTKHLAGKRTAWPEETSCIRNGCVVCWVFVTSQGLPFIWKAFFLSSKLPLEQTVAPANTWDIYCSVAV